MSFVDRNDGPIGNLAELVPWGDVEEAMRDPQKLYDSLVAQNLDIQKILWQLKHRHLALRVEAAISNRIAYQTLVTTGSNLTSGEMHSVTKTQSVLTTASETADEFDWRNPKYESLIVVGPGDGVEPHMFGVNPDSQYWGGAWGYDGNGQIVQRNGLVMPYADGTSLQLIFFEFDSTDNYLPKPVDLGIGTTIYLQQRLPGDA